MMTGKLFITSLALIYLANGCISSQPQNRHDTIDIGNMTVNDLPGRGILDSLISVLGPPDMVRQLGHGGKSYYYENTRIAFEVSGSEYIVSSIFFEDEGTKAYLPKMTLSEETMPEDIERAFPNSFKHRRIMDNGEEKVYLGSDIPDSRGVKRVIELHFRQRKLLSLLLV